MAGGAKYVAMCSASVMVHAARATRRSFPPGFQPEWRSGARRRQPNRGHRRTLCGAELRRTAPARRPSPCHRRSASADPPSVPRPAPPRPPSRCSRPASDRPHRRHAAPRGRLPVGNISSGQPVSDQPTQRSGVLLPSVRSRPSGIARTRPEPSRYSIRGLYCRLKPPSIDGQEVAARGLLDQERRRRCRDSSARHTRVTVDAAPLDHAGYAPLNLLLSS